jgi:hypothetical protein
MRFIFWLLFFSWSTTVKQRLHGLGPAPVIVQTTAEAIGYIETWESINKREFKAPLRGAPFFESALRKNVTGLSTSAHLVFVTAHAVFRQSSPSLRLVSHQQGGAL